MRFARHAESEHNKLYPGRLDIGDPPLTLDGDLAALTLGTYLPYLGVKRIITSSAMRARNTGVIAAGGLPVYSDSRIGEVDWGTDAGRRVSDVFRGRITIEGIYKGLDWRPNHTAESPLQVANRVLTAIEDWGEPDDLYVMHNFAFKSLVAVCLEWDRSEMINFKIKNCEVYEFDPFNPRYPSLLYPLQAEGQTQPSSSAIRL